MLYKDFSIEQLVTHAKQYSICYELLSDEFKQYLDSTGALYICRPTNGIAFLESPLIENCKYIDKNLLLKHSQDNRAGRFITISNLKKCFIQE